MTAYLLDTNAASALFDELNPYHKQAWSFLESLGEYRIYIPCVTWGEIRYGYKVHDKVDESRKNSIENQMTKYQVLEIDKHTTDPYSTIRSQLFSRFASKDKRGKMKKKIPEDLMDKTTGKTLGIQENDLWIVAIAAEHKLQIITNDKMKRLREITQEIYPHLTFWDWKTGKILK